MRKLQEIISIILIFTVLPLISNADQDPCDLYGIGTYEIGPGKDWDVISKLRTYDEITIKIYEGGGVGYFWMYDNSKLIKYDGSIVNLYLYDNTTASFFGGSAPMDIYVDPANTGWVKFYANNVTYDQSGIFGNWLSDGQYFQIDFTGDTYSHVQIIPEPTTLALLALGSLSLLRRR